MNSFYLKYRHPILVIALMGALGGVFSLLNIQSLLFPDITFPKIKIIAEVGQQPSERMMATVTVPMEEAIKKVENLQLIHSTTSRGSCEISAFLDWNTDVDLGKQRIEARLAEIRQELPQDVSITVEKMNPSILQVMGFSLEGEGRSAIELRRIAEFTVKPFFSRIPGISDVAVMGGRVKEYHVLFDAVRLSRLGLTPQAVQGALLQSNAVSSAGYVQDFHRQYLAVTDGSIQSKEALEHAVISGSPKRTIRVQDVARVEVGEKKELVRINANGKDVPLLAVMKQPNANLLEVSRAVHARMGELARLLPKGVRLVPYYDQAQFVGDAIGSLRDVLWAGLLLAIVVTVLFLRSVKASAVILLTIPVTLGVTVAALYATGQTMNIMTIGAIAAAIGLVIDDAIVVVEQIHRTHEEHPEANSFDLCSKAVRYLFPAMVGSSLSTIVIFLPFALMTGVAGAYFRVMTNTMIMTLVASFFVTWICLPAFYIFLSRERHTVREAPRSVRQRVWVYGVIRRPVVAVGIAAAFILLSLFILPVLPSGFLPEMDEGSIVLDYVSPPGTSLDETASMLGHVDRILSATPEVASFSRRTGTQMGFFITEANTGDYLIQLKKDRTKTTEEVSDEIRSRIESSLPSLRVDFGQVIGDMLGDLMSSVQPVEVKIFGDDTKTLHELARQVAAVVDSTPGTADTFNGITIAGPELTFRPKQAALSSYHVTPQDLELQMLTKIDGAQAGSILEKNALVTIRLLEEPRARSVEDLRRTSLFLPDGRLKPAAEFADITVRPGVAQIERENLQKMVAVTARLNNRDLGSVLSEIRKKIASTVPLPPGFEIVYGGSYAGQQQAFRELFEILVLAALLVFTVILFLFRNVKVALAIIAVAVLGIAGSLVALFVTHTPLNVGSYTGIIMIIGIIGENSIFTYLQYAQSRAGGAHRDDAIAYSISTRLRPKLMTALGAIVALLPLALGLGTGAELHQPLAIAIIGGLVFALPLLLLVLPTVLRAIEPGGETGQDLEPLS